MGSFSSCGMQNQLPFLCQILRSQYVITMHKTRKHLGIRNEVIRIQITSNSQITLNVAQHLRHASHDEYAQKMCFGWPHTFLSDNLSSAACNQGPFMMGVSLLTMSDCVFHVCDMSKIQWAMTLRQVIYNPRRFCTHAIFTCGQS